MVSVKASVVYSDPDHAVKPQYPLYPHQRQVFQDILRALSTPGRRAIAHLPTGAGKTRIASHVTCRLLNECDTDRALIVWLAATEELCDQAADELSKAWTHLGQRDIQIHRYWGTYALDLRRLSAGFLVTGLAKLRAAAYSDHTVLASLVPHVAGVIFDEAHQAIANTYQFVTEQLCSARPPLLGLTATPGRTASLTEDDYRLADMFNGTKVSIDPKGHDSPVTYLIQNQYLANPRFVPISFDSSTTIAEPATAVDYSKEDLDRLGEDRFRTLKIVALAHGAAKRHPRTIVFCPSIESAVECSRLLSLQDVVSDVVTAKTHPEDRRARIAAFKSDSREHMVMFNYGVLTAGFDAPRTRCAIIARPTTSLVLYSQMAGRAMRGPRSGGNRNAEILTVADTNLPGFGSVTGAFTNWEELWSNRLPN